MLYDINPIFSIYINKLSTTYLFLNSPDVKSFYRLWRCQVFLQAMALQHFLHCFVIVSADLLV
jgi:hypothetical protein